MNIILSLIISLIAGVGLGFLIFRIYKEQILRKAKEEAQEIHDEVKEWIEHKTLEENEKFQEIETSLWAKNDVEILKYEENIENLQEIIEENKKKQDDRWSKIKNANQLYEREVQNQENRIKNREKHLDSLKENIKSLSEQMTQRIVEKFNFSIPEIKTSIAEGIEKEVRDRAAKMLEILDEDLKMHAESKAKQYLDTALDRFIRPYCAERGIGAVQFPEDPHYRKNFCDLKNAIIN